METVMNGRRWWQSSVWRIRHALNAAQWHHITAIGLLVFSALVLAVIDYPLYVETRRLTSQFDARSALNANERKPVMRKNSSRDSVQAFIASLPSFDSYPAQLHSFAKLADKNTVRIIRIDYQYERIAALPIKKLILHLELRGGETQQREFLRVALNTFPNLSVTRLAYTKSADPVAIVDEKLDVNLYYRWEKAQT